MYKIEYTKFPIMADGSAGNIARGCGVAYADCELDCVEARLNNDLKAEHKEHKFIPHITKVKLIQGHIIT